MESLADMEPVVAVGQGLLFGMVVVGTCVRLDAQEPRPGLRCLPGPLATGRFICALARCGAIPDLAASGGHGRPPGVALTALGSARRGYAV